MRQRLYSIYYVTFLLLLVCPRPANCQMLPIDQLEQRVYQLNNALRYTESQKLLLPLLHNNSLTTEYRYQVAVLLSYTYKRVFDYQSALKFLDQAQKLAQRVPYYEPHVATIQAEKAFIYFDTQDYRRSDRLMKVLERSGFKHISLENKAKLVMQQGYLLFLTKQYRAAEVTYDNAIRLMRASTPCHLPMIFVKKMQLYNATNRLDLLHKAVRQSSQCADSCHILKYHLYANEELLTIYVSRNDIAQIKLTKKKLDSLNVLYKREEKIAALHNQKETILLGSKEQEVQREHSSKEHLIITLIGCALLIITLSGCLIMYKRHKQKAEQGYVQAKQELEKFVAIANQPASLGRQERLDVLSQRQYKVLECLTAGMSNKQIADKLFISENTVKYHIKNIYQLLDIKDRKDLLVNIKKVTAESSINPTNGLLISPDSV